jgi:CHRD domain
VGDEFNVAPNNQLGDGVDYNDRQFLDKFPYVAIPYEGFEHKHHRQKPADNDETKTSGENADVTEVNVQLEELGNSGVSGTATLTAEGDQTKVVLDVEGATGDHPVHIHNGTCTNLQDVVFPLTNIDASGNSETTVDIKLSDLLDGEYAINAHLSADQISTYVTCGEIVT